jgi:hypothetical protein
MFSSNRVRGVLKAMSILGFCALQGTPHAKAQDAMKVAFTEFPPFAYSKVLAEKNGNGWVVDLYNQAFDSLKIKHLEIEIQGKRAFSSLEQGEADFYTCSEFHHRGKIAEQFLLSKISLPLSATLYWMDGPEEIQDLSKVENKTVLTVAGIESFLSLLSKTMKKEPAVDSKTGVKMFVEKKAEYLADYEERASFHLKAASSTLTIRSKLLKKVQSKICWKKSLPNSEKTFADFQDKILQIQESAAGKALTEKYGYTGKWVK